MKTQLNILIAIESFFDGGAEMFAIRLANALASDHHVYFLELDVYKTIEKKQLSLLDLEKVKLIQTGKNQMAAILYQQTQRRSGRIWNYFERRYEVNKKKAIRRVIKKYAIDIVNSHSWDTDVYFGKLKNEAIFRLISSFHGHYEFLRDLRNGFDMATRDALRNLDGVIYTSSEHLSTLNQYDYPLSRRHKIFYGLSMKISENTTTYKPGDCLKLVMAARGIVEKGWVEAIGSIKILEKKYPGRVELNLVGSGDCIDELKEKYQEPFIVFHGYKESVRELVEDAHVGLLPTYYKGESLPNTIIEYLFCGKPVITTNVGAIKEMIFTNQQLAGTCIDLDNGKVNEDAILVAIENYIINPWLVEKHSYVALNAADKFTMKSCVDNYLLVFKQYAQNQNLA